MYLQTTAILVELGAPRLAAVLGVEHEQVSLAACNLLHVMFDSLKEGLQKDFRGKEDAVVLGECGLFAAACHCSLQQSQALIQG